jgi:hypothetical protein
MYYKKILPSVGFTRARKVSLYVQKLKKGNLAGDRQRLRKCPFGSQAHNPYQADGGSKSNKSLQRFAIPSDRVVKSSDAFGKESEEFGSITQTHFIGYWQERYNAHRVGA